MSNTLFVGRERELQRLETFLGRACGAQSQVCFIAGEAGNGKSTLTEEFTRRAQDANPDLVVAQGMCSSQTGSGDPYLPFREILAQLTGNVRAKVAEENAGPSQHNSVRVKELVRVSAATLLEVAPDLVGILVPGGSLATRAARTMADKAGMLDKIKAPVKKETKAEPVVAAELDRSKLMEQYTAALQTLAQLKPLCLVLEDLHWADSASLDLLFHLSRQLKDARVLLIGTYRPDDIAIGRDGAPHPLESILSEIKRYRGDIIIDLSASVANEAEQLVNALLDAEPNRLSAEFHKDFLAKTRGHPLFTTELLRAMQENGDLVRDEEGCWVATPTLHWETLPARVEGVIQTRISRLPEPLCDLLRTASVEGVDFAAQIVAQAQQADERQVLKDLSRELARKYRLVQEQGETRVGRRILSAFQFAHALIQQYLYCDLGPSERRMLHGEIAQALENSYGGQTDAVAVQLAHHYEQALEVDKAVQYLCRAGALAYQISAFREAAGFFARALALVEGEAPSVRVPVLLNLGCSYYAWGKLPEATGTLDECLKLARGVDDKAVADAQYYLGLIYLRSGKRADAQSLLEESLRAQERLGDRAKLGGGYCALGGLAARQGDLGLAKEHALKGVSILQELGEGPALASAYNAIGTFCLQSGEFEVAEAHFRTALGMYQRLKDRVGCSRILNNLGSLYHDQGNGTEAVKQYEECLAIQRDLSNPDLMAAVLGNLSETSLEMSDLARAKRYGLEALQVMLETGLVPFVLEMLFVFARILDKEGKCTEAAEILGLVRSHPQSDHRSKRHIEQFLETWACGMTPEALAAALEKGSHRDLTRVVDELRRV